MISLKQILSEVNPFKQQVHAKMAIDLGDIEQYFPKLTIANLNSLREKIKREDNPWRCEVTKKALELVDAELKRRISYIKGKRK